MRNVDSFPKLEHKRRCVSAFGNRNVWDSVYGLREFDSDATTDPIDRNNVKSVAGF